MDIGRGFGLPAGGHWPAMRQFADRTWRIMLCLVLILPVSANATAPVTPVTPVTVTGFVPDWSEGESWDVDYRTRMMPSPDAIKTGESKLAEPYRLHFQVVKVEQAKQQRFYTVQVSCPKDPTLLKAGLVFVGELGPDGVPTSLALARYQFEAQGPDGIIKDDIRPHVQADTPFPVLTGEALVPLDFPYFSRALVPPEKGDVVRSFEVAQPAPGFNYLDPVLQKVRRAGTALPMPKLPVRIKSSPAIEYMFIRKSDLARCRQIWHPKKPWFLWSESTSGQAELVMAPQPKPTTH